MQRPVANCCSVSGVCVCESYCGKYIEMNDALEAPPCDYCTALYKLVSATCPNRSVVSLHGHQPCSLTHLRLRRRGKCMGNLPARVPTEALQTLSDDQGKDTSPLRNADSANQPIHTHSQRPTGSLAASST